MPAEAVVECREATEPERPARAAERPELTSRDGQALPYFRLTQLIGSSARVPAPAGSARGEAGRRPGRASSSTRSWVPARPWCDRSAALFRGVPGISGSTIRAQRRGRLDPGRGRPDAAGPARCGAARVEPAVFRSRPRDVRRRSRPRAGDRALRERGARALDAVVRARAVGASGRSGARHRSGRQVRSRPRDGRTAIERRRGGRAYRRGSGTGGLPRQRAQQGRGDRRERRGTGAGAGRRSACGVPARGGRRRGPSRLPRRPRPHVFGHRR